jgi:hypothetical protein
MMVFLKERIQFETESQMQDSASVFQLNILKTSRTLTDDGEWKTELLQSNYLADLYIVTFSTPWTYVYTLYNDRSLAETAIEESAWIVESKRNQQLSCRVCGAAAGECDGYCTALPNELDDVSEFI